jgi:uroporphyrin-III C-methyltransferase
MSIASFTEGPRAGTVYLVGAGPGDPGLLTLRAASLLAGATEIYHDYLVSDGVLALCNPNARLIDVGKTGHGLQTAQEVISAQLVASAQAGHRVVRLKGGDPLLFGRGAEEALELDAAGIPFEIVPGVSSALAVPACAGIPLTARGQARSVAIVTGHSLSGAPAPIPIADTIVVLMGVANAAVIRDQLVATGLDPRTPSAVIEWGTWARQRVVTAALDDLPDAIARAGVGAPAVLVIGDVVTLRRRLSPGAAGTRAADEQRCSFQTT